MTREERKPTGLLHSADELKQLIVENPDLPTPARLDQRQGQSSRYV